MLYKFPMPTRHSRVKLYALPDQQLGIEVGRPPAATMAYDAELARGRTVTIRCPDIDRIIRNAVKQVDAQDALPRPFMSRSKDMQKPLDAPDITDDDNDEDNTDAIVGKLMVFLKDLISPEDLERAAAILGGGDEDDADEARKDASDRARRQASDRGLAGREARRRAEDADFERLFPTAKLVLRR
jgi:hypothetical protein